MPARKRGRVEADLDSSFVKAEEPVHNETLHRLRNMWEFASFMQYVFFFGKIVKIDEDVDIEVRSTSRLAKGLVVEDGHGG